MIGHTLAKWLLERQTILEFPEDGFGLHQLCPPTPVGEKGVQLWKLALNPTLPGDEGQAQFHAPSSPIMTFLFLAHGSCLCPEEEMGGIILLIALEKRSNTVSTDLMLPDFNSGSAESGTGRSGQVFTCFDRAGTCRPF